jgi:hypothetical protein
MAYFELRSAKTLSRGIRAWGQPLIHVFRSETRPVSYDMLFKDPADGCARHDDVWGG